MGCSVSQIWYDPGVKTNWAWPDAFVNNVSPAPVPVFVTVTVHPTNGDQAVVATVTVIRVDTAGGVAVAVDVAVGDGGSVGVGVGVFMGVGVGVAVGVGGVVCPTKTSVAAPWALTPSVVTAPAVNGYVPTADALAVSATNALMRAGM